MQTPWRSAKLDLRSANFYLADVGSAVNTQHQGRNMMFQRISSLILLFCLTAALLPHGNAAAANQKPEYFANSDVEAYIEEYLYGMDEEQGNRLYRESREHSGRVYLTEASVLQICSAGQRLFALTRESGKSVISCLDLETWQWSRVTETIAEISRFSVAGSRLYYLADEAIFYRDLDTGHSSALLRREGLSRFWLAGPELVDYMLADGNVVYRYHTTTGEITSYTNPKKRPENQLFCFSPKGTCRNTPHPGPVEGEVSGRNVLESCG